jgi:hypothetical protein
MIYEAVFKSVAEQMMKGDAVEVEGKRYALRKTSSKRLKMVTFQVDGEEYAAIEQNPEKQSRWGKLAREGRKVVQFKGVKENRFVAVVVDGEVKSYK